MMWRTHVLFGISALWLLTPLSPDIQPYDYGTLVMAAAFGALLPDLDAAESKIKHLKIGLFEPFSIPAHLAYHSGGHRGMLHSLAGWSLAGFLCLCLLPWLDWTPLLALWLGYGSHLLADAATKSGLYLLYPWKRRYFLLPQRWRITTGSLAEEVVLALLTFPVFLLLMVRLYPSA